MGIIVLCKYASTGRAIPVKVTVSHGMGISEIIGRLVEVYEENPFDIDNGLCDDFASDLIHALESIGEVADIRWTSDDTALPGHCWVEVAGRFYDAETPFGVSHWQELTIFKQHLPQ